MMGTHRANTVLRRQKKKKADRPDQSNGGTTPATMLLLRLLVVEVGVTKGVRGDICMSMRTPTAPYRGSHMSSRCAQQNFPCVPYRQASHRDVHFLLHYEKTKVRAPNPPVRRFNGCLFANWCLKAMNYDKQYSLMVQIKLHLITYSVPLRKVATAITIILSILLQNTTVVPTIQAALHRDQQPEYGQSKRGMKVNELTQQHTINTTVCRRQLIVYLVSAASRTVEQ